MAGSPGSAAAHGTPASDRPPGAGERTPAGRAGDGESAPVVTPRSGAPPAEAPRLRPGFQDLAVEGFLPSLAFVPSATAARPLVVVLHGAGGRAEPHCERWRALTRGAAFLVCPRGAPLGLTPAGGEPAGYFYPDHHALGREVLAALEAARRAFGAHLDLERPLFAGYSQGAAMGALFLHDLAKKDLAPVRFGAAALVEGGAGAFDVPLSQRLVARGLRRVLLACGQRSCARDAERSVPWMRRAGLEVRFEDAPGAGHTWGGAVGADVEAALPWLLEGDPRWGGGEEPPP